MQVNFRSYCVNFTFFFYYTHQCECSNKAKKRYMNTPFSHTIMTTHYRYVVFPPLTLAIDTP